MSPKAPINNSSVENTSNVQLLAEGSDEASTTHHEPNLLVECSPPQEESESAKDRRRIADMADKACRRASTKSNVLTRSNVADIALLSIEELTIGKWLGKGSFSNVHEISSIALNDEITIKQTSEGTKIARNILSSNYLRKQTNREDNSSNGASNSTCRYAIKFLKKELRQNHKKYAVGTTDLVVEGLFLASLTHPNIIKVRGLPEGGVHSMVENHGSNNDTTGIGGYFLILDRLFDTLSERIYKHWVKDHQDVRVHNTGKRENVLDRFLFKGSGGNKMKEVMNSDLAVRVKVAFDISAALKYLHEKSIIYRDLVSFGSIIAAAATAACVYDCWTLSNVDSMCFSPICRNLKTWDLMVSSIYNYLQ
jgi:hypothetical protein